MKWITSIEGKSPVVTILKEFTSEEDAFSFESRMIDQFRSLGCRLINKSNGGKGPNGYKFTEKQRAQASLSHKGKPPYKITEEIRKKLSDSHKGQVHNQNLFHQILN